MARSDDASPNPSDRRRRDDRSDDNVNESTSHRRHDDDRHRRSKNRDRSRSTEGSSRRSHKRDRSRNRSPDRDRDRKRHHRDRSSRERSRSKDRRRHQRHHSRSRTRSRDRHSRDDRSRSLDRRKREDRQSRSPPRRSKAPLPSQNDSFRAIEGGPAASDGPPVEKQKPNFKPTGLLAKEANTVEGTTTVLKYHEPPDARKPSAKEQWRMYVFKKKDLLDTVYIHQRSCWLVGRDETVTDMFVEHPSISKQHAVIQFRHVTSRNQYGDEKSKVKPYLIDLESANGTLLNGKKIETSRFVEMVDGDVVKFGDSEREYVLMLPPPDT